MPGMKYEAQNIKFYVEFTCRILLGDDADWIQSVYCANEERVEPYTLTLRSGHGAISCYSVNTFLNRKAIREKEAINKGNIVVLYIQNIVSVVGLMLQAFCMIDR